MGSYHFNQSSGMWRVVFYERRANRIHVDRTGPWLPERALAHNWAMWFLERGYHVAVQDSSGSLDRLSKGLPA